MPSVEDIVTCTDITERVWASKRTVRRWLATAGHPKPLKRSAGHGTLYLWPDVWRIGYVRPGDSTTFAG